jgi:pimeloyl-ACP methyl ester carboxylesterase
VDLIGSSLGSSLAIALGGERSPIDPDHIGRIVVTSNVYREVTPLFQSVFFSPDVQALLEGAPDGYVTTPPDSYGLILALATPEAAVYGFATFPGMYAVGPTLEGFDLPVFDATYGRAPLLQVWGDADLITPRSDVDRFQSEYGGHAQLAVLPGGSHAPNFEPVRELFWDRVFEFFDVAPGVCARRRARR